MLDQQQLRELLVQSLEHERGGVKLYETALEVTVSDELRDEWTEYLTQTRRHVQILEHVLQKFEIDPDLETPGRRLVRDLGASLVGAILRARQACNPAAAQIVACECVVIAETKDHANWELLGKCAAELKGGHKQALEEACAIVEDEEDEHLYHNAGWTRELWLDSLGLKAVLPPPEEREQVKTAMGAARAAKESERSR